MASPLFRVVVSSPDSSPEHQRQKWSVTAAVRQHWPPCMARRGRSPARSAPCCSWIWSGPVWGSTRISSAALDGRRPRPGGAEDACRRKAQLGMDILGLPLGLASEGSRPSTRRCPSWRPACELMVFLDQDHGLEIWERLIARRTNFDHRRAAGWRSWRAGLNGWASPATA